MATQIKICDLSGSDAGKLDVPAQLLDVTPRRDVLHAVVVWQQAKKRQWNANTKTRSEVAGGGAKPWRQKGTGRARAGTRRSPLWRGGGVVFGPRTKSGVAPSLPKKVRRLGLRMALADRLAEDKLVVVKDLAFQEPSTGKARAVVDAFDGSKKLVIVGDGREGKGISSATEKSFRNIDNVRVLQAEGLNVYDILNAESVLIAEDAIEKVFTRLGGEKS